MTLQIKVLSQTDFAAQVSGIDLRAGISADIRDEIEALLVRFPVLCFRKQAITDDMQQAFIEHFGPAAAPIAELSTGESRRHPHLFDVATVDEDGKPIDSRSAYGLYMLANQLWHTDGSQAQVPIRLSALSARTLPPEPPGTHYADMRAAWDALDPQRQAQLEPLIAQHSIVASRAKVGMRPEQFSEETRARRPPVPHPLVRTHPRSARKSLYLSAHAFRIEGLADTQGGELLEELTAFATQPRFVYAHQWEPDDLVIWDNSVTMHRATPYTQAAARVMRWAGAREPHPV